MIATAKQQVANAPPQPSGIGALVSLAVNLVGTVLGGLGSGGGAQGPQLPDVQPWLDMKKG